MKQQRKSVAILVLGSKNEVLRYIDKCEHLVNSQMIQVQVCFLP